MERICTASDKFGYHINAIIPCSKEQGSLSIGIDFISITAVLEEQLEGFQFAIFRDVEHYRLLQLVAEERISTCNRYAQEVN